MIILTGSEDGSHPGSFALQARVPNCELKTLPGAGHACQIEQPWLFNRFMIEFLDKHGLFPGDETGEIDCLNGGPGLAVTHQFSCPRFFGPRLTVA